MKQDIQYSLRPNIRTVILQKIAGLGIATLSGFFPKQYPEARIWRQILGLDESYKFSKSNFSAILSKLRRDGFIEKIGKRNKSTIWKITQKGRWKITHNNGLLRTSPKPDGIPRIISYDIPEKKRSARYWLRNQLTEHDYRQLQKSVWVGFTPLSEDFIKNIQTLSIENCVHIFSINKKGTVSFQDFDKTKIV